MRNALNGLAVNLEVVRALTVSSTPSVEPYMTHALEQSEESARLAESAVALMNLVIGAVGEDGRMECESKGARGVEIFVERDLERLYAALQPLVRKGALTVEPSRSAVILRVPEKSPE
jgi:hypothetical protein